MSCFQNEFDLLDKNHRQVFLKKKPVYTANLITQAGPFYVDWGNNEEERTLHDVRFGNTIGLHGEERRFFFEKLLSKPIGEVKANYDRLDEPMAKRMWKIAPDFFFITCSPLKRQLQDPLWKHLRIKVLKPRCNQFWIRGSRPMAKAIGYTRSPQPSFSDAWAPARTINPVNSVV